MANDRIRIAADPNRRPSYELWLNQIISTYRTVLEGKADGKPDSRDKAFWRFLLDLPDVPGNVLDILRDLCAEAQKLVLYRAVINLDH